MITVSPYRPVDGKAKGTKNESQDRNVIVM